MEIVIPVLFTPQDVLCESALDKSLRVVSGVDLGSISMATCKSIFTVVDLLLESVYSSLLSTALVSLLDCQLHS